jgi:hypothetical protein
MKQHRYITTAVLIAVKGRKRTTTIENFTPVPLKKLLMSRHRVAEDGSIITNVQKVLTVTN